MNDYTEIIYNSKYGSVRCFVIDGKICVPQKDVATLFNVDKSKITRWIQKCEKNGYPVAKMQLTSCGHKNFCIDLDSIITLSQNTDDISIFDFEKWAQNISKTKEEDNYKIVRFNQDKIELDVRISPKEETVWMTEEEIATLFERNQSVISRHINNIFKEGELDRDTSMHFLHKSPNGENPDYRPPVFYNLDVVISVGYRVKSKRGVLFRKWANSVFKQYLYCGYAIDDNRVLSFSENIAELNQSVNRLNNKTSDMENRLEKVEMKYEEKMLGKIISNGEFFDSLIYIRNIIESANSSIIIIDPYFDDKSLYFVITKKKEIPLSIITSNKSNLGNVEINKYISQSGEIHIYYNNSFHDRFIVVDNNSFYHLGASLNYLGKTISYIDLIKKDNVDAISYLTRKINNIIHI